MAKKIVKNNVDNGGLTNKEIEQGNKVLDTINSANAKTKENYLAFGKLWLKVKAECTPEGLNKNGNPFQPDTKRMGTIRVDRFGDKIDVHTASYAARMAEYWEAGYEGFMPLKEWQEKNSPRASNPRPLVQAYIKAKKAEEAKANEANNDGDNDGDGDKEPGDNKANADMVYKQFAEACTKLIKSLDNGIFDKEQMAAIDKTLKLTAKRFDTALADGKMASVDDKKKAA